MDKFLEKNGHFLKNPIIIFGTGRSGTTVISDIIFHHPDLAWHSNYQELFPKSTRINYLRRFFDNRLWKLVGMNTQNNKTLINQLYFRPIERYDFWESVTPKRIDFSRGFLLNERATDSEREKMRKHFAAMVKYQKRKRLAFKITGPARMEFLHSIFPDAVFVQIMRDPVATVRSWLEVGWSDKITDQLWWTGAYSEAELETAKALSKEPPLFAAFQYKKLMEATRKEIQKTKATVHTVHYEDFVKDPVNFISRLLEKLDLRPSNEVDAFMEKISVQNRNQRPASSAKTVFDEQTKDRIRAIVAEDITAS